MTKQSGQGIVEYALILAMVAGIGLCLYSSNGQGGLAESIRSVFNQTAELLGKESLSVAQSSSEIIERLHDGRFGKLTDLLGDPQQKGQEIEISSDSEKGREIARKLNIQTKDGDGWYVKIHPNGHYVVTYYSAVDNKGTTFDQLKAAYNRNSGYYYNKDGEKNSKYPHTIYVDEGNYDPQGNGKTYFKTTGHVGPSADGTGMSIYPGRW